MSKEFENIVRFFDLDPEEKQKHLKEVFEESIEFFEKFKYVMQNGTREEKASMLEQVRQMQEVLQDETEKVKKATGLTEEELVAFTDTKTNFEDEDWDIIQDAKKEIGKQADEIAEIVGVKAEPKEQKAKSPKKRKKWVKS